MNRAIVLVLAAGLALSGFACGGGKGKGAADPGSVKGPPATVKPNAKVQRKVSSESKKQFAEAVAYYKEQEKAGWNESNCAEAAGRFRELANMADKMVEAYFNAGVVYQKCGDIGKAEEMYKSAISILPSHAPSLSNMGEIFYRKGNESLAKQYWEKAFEADKKVVAAQNNLAWLLYQQMRRTENPQARRELEKQALTFLQRALAVDNDNIVAYTIMALIYLEGSETNRSRLDVANLLLEEGKKRNDRYAPLYNAWGLLQLRKENVSLALRHFQTAIEIDPTFTEARMNVARVVGDFRKYQEAEQHYRQVLEAKSLTKETRYDALIGLGFALRGQGKIDEAEKQYTEAMELDKTQGAAYYNMGLLWKDFRTNDPNPKSNKEAYQKAKQYFTQFMGREGLTKDQRVAAQNQLEDTDEAIKILSQAIETMDSQPPAAPAAPASGQG